jgi:hypothetical protein
MGVEHPLHQSQTVIAALEKPCMIVDQLTKYVNVK